MTTGDISTLLVWAATTALTIALIAYAADLARIADATQRRTAAQAEARTAVAAGGGSVAVAVAPPAAPAGSAKAEGIARSTTYLGIALLFAGIVLRGVAAGRWPTANMYEFTIVGVFVAVTVHAVVQRRRVIAFLGVLVTGIAVLALALALNVFYIQADAVQPALQSYWLILHVGVAIIATGIFTVAFAASALQIVADVRASGPKPVDAPRAWTDGMRRAVVGPRFAWVDQVPAPRELEALAFRLNALGFVLWTFTLIGGAIWAEHAWGRYWGWDPKEVGTFVAWVVYAAYLHARTTRGWSGRRAAYFVFVGYAVVIANFTVVNLVFSGKHSYSGL
ncbi:c-type cytochrome biogenesis protein CcsB [Cellulomonas fimi]|uniref:c-type cytochrome biogenesis protein CcsB n=1 Tax=Cellulomonas fimi TaxID=1708 RepID=UPI002359D19B|nr:c-type cytochrome biogenesis protein CcsB [Cellulomonas fimi]